MINTLTDLLTLFGVALPLIITILTLIAQVSKNKKLAKGADDLNKMTQEVLKFVIMAETFNGRKGPEKKAWVIDKVIGYAKEKGIYVNVETISDLIEQALVLSKKVNARDKDLK
jgi:hypothetical protein